MSVAAKCFQLNVLRSKFYERVKQGREDGWRCCLVGSDVSSCISPINNICTFWSIEPWWRRRKVAGHDFHCEQEREERGGGRLDQLLLSAVAS